MNQQNSNKEIWSDNYGKDHKKGLHLWLEKNMKGYKREDIDKICELFVAKCKPQKTGDTPTLTASLNFSSFINFIKSNKW